MVVMKGGEERAVVRDWGGMGASTGVEARRARAVGEVMADGGGADTGAAGVWRVEVGVEIWVRVRVCMRTRQSR